MKSKFDFSFHKHQSQNKNVLELTINIKDKTSDAFLFYVMEVYTNINYRTKLFQFRKTVITNLTTQSIPPEERKKSTHGPWHEVTWLFFILKGLLVYSWGDSN